MIHQEDVRTDKAIPPFKREREAGPASEEASGLNPRNSDVSRVLSPLVSQGTSKVSASKLITSQRTQITKLTQQNISSVSTSQLYLLHGDGFCPPTFRAQTPGLSRGPCFSRRPASFPPARRPNLHGCCSLCLQHLSLPSFSGKLLLIHQVSLKHHLFQEVLHAPEQIPRAQHFHQAIESLSM